MLGKHFHFHIHTEPDVRIDQLLTQVNTLIMTVQELNEKLDAVRVNVNEQANEVGRIREVIQAIRDQLANGLSAEDAEALGVSLDELIASTQSVEDTLRQTN